MTRKPTLRQLLVSVLAFWRDRSHKEIGAAAGIPQKRVSLYLRRGEIPDEAFGKLLDAVECPPHAIFSVTACLEKLEVLESETNLTVGEKVEISHSLLRTDRCVLPGLIEAARHSRTAAAEGSPGEVRAAAYDRQRAAELFRRLEGLPPAARLALVERGARSTGAGPCASGSARRRSARPPASWSGRRTGRTSPGRSRSGCGVPRSGATASGATRRPMGPTC
jgi:hypothetical protein